MCAAVCTGTDTMSLDRISRASMAEVGVQQADTGCCCLRWHKARSSRKRVIVIRHGQAEHNVNAAANLKRHAKLTQQGRLECLAARDPILELAPDVVICSPVLRALQTTANIFADAHAHVIVHGDAREVWTEEKNLCEAPFDLQDNGEAPLEFAHYDWSPVRIAAGADHASRRSSLGRVLTKAWERRCVEMDQDFKRLQRRATRLTRFIQNRPEATVCLVSHAAILGLVTGDNKEGPMRNCEARVYSLNRRGRWTLLHTIPAPTSADTMHVAMTAVIDAAEPAAQQNEPEKV